MTINDKIKQILIDKNFTPSYFADEIGVQRSSISHILSGRNRPSFDIIQKIIRRFPDLGYEWIMEEEDRDRNNDSLHSNYANRTITQSANPRSPERYSSTSATRADNKPIVDNRLQRNEIAPALPKLSDENSIRGSQDTDLHVNSTASPAGRKIERILIFFTDGSFKEYSSVN